MTVKKEFKTVSAVTLILISIILSGCSAGPEPEAAKTGNVNQPATIFNNNVNQSPTVSGNNSVAAVNAPNIPAPNVGGNASAPIVNRDRKPAPAVKEPVPQIGGGGGDLALFAQARGALGSDEELSRAVIIEIKEGNVALTGSVSSEAQKTKAGQLIQSVAGIKSVKNNLRVSP